MLVPALVEEWLSRVFFPNPATGLSDVCKPSVVSGRQVNGRDHPSKQCFVRGNTRKNTLLKSSQATLY